MKLKPTLKKTIELGFALSSITMLILTGCGGGNSSSTPDTSTTSAIITPYKGPFAAGATITVKDASGSSVPLTSGGTVDANGVANISFSSNVSYPLVVEVAGSCLNEATGALETSTTPIRSVVPTAASTQNIPVTLITEVAVAELQQQLGGSFSLGQQIQAASAAAALDAAGTIFGIPASAVPSFDAATYQTSDPDTIRLAALGVAVDGIVAGATLVDKVANLATMFASAPADSTPVSVIPQTAVDAAITAVTSGPNSIAASGVVPPSSPLILSSSSLYAPSEMAGSWVGHRLQVGRTLDVAAGTNTNQWGYLSEIWNTAGIVTPISTTNSSGNTITGEPDFTQMVLPDGTVADPIYPNIHGTVSIDRKLLVYTKTQSNNLDYRLIIQQKQDPAITFTTADLAGTWNAHMLRAGRTTDIIAGTATNKWAHGVETWDVNGIATPVSTLDSLGSTAVGAPYTLAIASDGTITNPADASVHGTMSPSKDLIVMTGTAGNGLDPKLIIFQKQDNAVGFSSADMSGTTWVKHRLQAGQTLDVALGTTTNNWSHTVEVWDNVGVSSTSSRLDSDGNTTVSAPTSWNIAADGTITSPADASVHGTMSPSKDLIIVTRNATNGVDSRLVIFQKR